MAEFVSSCPERIPLAYDEMRKKKIYTDDEIRKLIKTRETFGFKIQKRNKTLKDYLEFVDFENKILRKIDKLESITNEKYIIIENNLVHNIKFLYNEALGLFPKEVRLWDLFLKFLKKRNFITEVTKTYEKMFQFHENKPAVWLQAGIWEYEGVGNLERSKDLFFRGLQKHPEDSKLYLQLFSILLTEADKMSAEVTFQGGCSPRSLGVEKAVVVYKSSKNKIHNIEYLAELLNICEKYLFTKDIQKIIIDDMIIKFITDEMLFHILAQRELKGFHMCDYAQKANPNIADEKLNVINIEGAAAIVVEEAPAEVETEKVAEVKLPDKVAVVENEAVLKKEVVAEKPAVAEIVMEAKAAESVRSEIPESKHIVNGFTPRTLKRRIELCYEVYEGAVKVIRSEKMWSLFINAMFDLNQDLSTQKLLKRSKLGDALRAAHEVNCLSEEHYLSYISLLTYNKEDLILEVIEKSVKLYPHSIKLWIQWLFFYIKKNNERKVNQVLREGTVQLSAAKSYPLWKMALQYYKSQFGFEDQVDDYYAEACQMTAPIFKAFRPEYLVWTFLNQSIFAVRNLYNSLIGLSPPCLELHQQMASIESTLLSPDITKWRNCHENACRDFGKTHTSVWIDYIKFEFEHGDVKKRSVLHERAVATLNSDWVQNFESEYSLFKI